MIIVYATDSARAGGNKVLMGANKWLHEVAYALLPCRKQRMTVVERKDKFVPQGADSTHCCAFTNATLPALAGLPRISKEEKAALFPAAAVGEPPRAVCPSQWEFGGVPLYWRESKAQEFWATLIKMFNAKSIVDFTPGSGACAAAAMSQGVKYTGFVESEKHLAWLQNIVDTAALRFICMQGEKLYMEDLSELIAKHYQHLLEAPDAEEAAEAEWILSEDEE